MRKRRTDEIERYLSEQRDLQQRLGRDFDQDALRRDQQLLWGWDFLSLGLCLRWEGRSVNGLTLGDGIVEPWPFAADAVHLRTEGRRLTGRYGTQAELHEALDRAPWVTLDFELRRLSR
jgi:hypothetical protein